MGASDFLSAYLKTREPESCTCIVKNLDDSVTIAQLKDLFSRHGEVKVVVIEETNAVIGSVEMSNLEEAKDAKTELNGYELNGHILEVHLRKLPGPMDLKPTRASISNAYPIGRTNREASISNAYPSGRTGGGASIDGQFQAP